MPADPLNELRAGTAGAPAADDLARPHDGQNSVADSAEPAKPRRKRAPRKTFEDGSLTRVFKFPSKKHPRSSYYVTGDEIIIRIKKARKRWKLVVPKKRLVSYRTNRWFAKPRWVEIELTYTQAVRQGLVEPQAKPSLSELPSEPFEPSATEPAPVSTFDAEHLPPALDSAVADEAEADVETEIDAGEFSGWVADDDTSAPGHEEAFETFEDALSEDAMPEDAEEAVASSPETDIETAAPNDDGGALRNDVQVATVPDAEPPSFAVEGLAVANAALAEPVIDRVSPTDTGTPIDRPFVDQLVQRYPRAGLASRLRARSKRMPAHRRRARFTPMVGRYETSGAGASDSPIAASSAGPEKVIAPAASYLQEDIVPQNLAAPLPPSNLPVPPAGTQRRRRYVGAQLLAASVALAVLGWTANWQRTPDTTADGGQCSAADPIACTDRDIVTGSIGVNETPAAPATETVAALEPEQQTASVPTPEPAAAPQPPATVALLPTEASPPELIQIERIQVEPAPAKSPAPALAVPIPAPVGPAAAIASPSVETAAPRNEASAPGVSAPVTMAAAAEATLHARQPAAPAPMRPCLARVSSIARDLTVQFGFASASLTPASQETLGQLAAALKPCSGVRMIIEGHTDSDGDSMRNQLLSLRRAIAVWRHLVESGAGDSQLVVIGYGQERPLVPNDSDANKSRNRRIRFVVE